MRFFHITAKQSNKSQEYFQSACIDRGIEYIKLIREESCPLRYLEYRLGVEDYLYRGASSAWALAMEKTLMSDTCKSVYSENLRALTGRGESPELMRRAGVPVIPFVPFIPYKRRDARALAEHLGGFPIALKVMGGKEGVGVVRVDSNESFNSVLDLLKKDIQANIYCMKYIPHKLYARLVVVGDSVVSATQDAAPIDDFRANARGPRKIEGSQYIPSPEIVTQSVQAVRSVGMKAGGVDVLFGEDGKNYFAEVNNPFNFAETQERTGIDIAGKMIDTMSS